MTEDEARRENCQHSVRDVHLAKQRLNVKKRRSVSNALDLSGLQKNNLKGS